MPDQAIKARELCQDPPRKPAKLYPYIDLMPTLYGIWYPQAKWIAGSARIMPDVQAVTFGTPEFADHVAKQEGPAYRYHVIAKYIPIAVMVKQDDGEYKQIRAFPPCNTSDGRV